MPYYTSANGDIAALIVGILSIIILVILSIVIIENNFKDKKIRGCLYLMLIIQIGIAVIDNYITTFPLMGYDARAFEGMGWFSYENGVNIGRGAYSDFIINPIYKLIKVRAATIFGAINIFANLLTNLNLYLILKKLNINQKGVRILMFISAFSPISLIFRSGILRESIIIMFVSYSLKCFVDYIIKKDNFEIIKAFTFIGIGTLFHSGMIFISGGYLIALLSGKKNQKIYQLLVIILMIIVFVLFQDKLLEKFGGGDVERIITANNYISLKEAPSGYLKNVTTTNLVEIVIYLPLFMFYFLYSPTPDLIRGGLDMITFLLNSSVFLYLTIGSIVIYKKIHKKLKLREKKIIKYLTISVIITTAVFSIGTRNFGTAIRHRDKILLLYILIFGILQNRYYFLERLKKRRRKNERAY